MRINADFSTIASSFEPLPDGDYIAVIESVEYGKSGTNDLATVNHTLVVDDPEHPELAGRKIFDNVFTEQMKGGRGPNKAGLGRIKAYAEAVLGEEAAGSTEGIDPDEYVGSKVRVQISSVQYQDKEGKTKTRNEVERVFSAE